MDNLERLREKTKKARERLCAILEDEADPLEARVRRAREEGTGDDSFVLGAEGSDDDEDVDGDGYWWWQSTEAKAARWVVPQWEVLAADRGGWRAGLKGLRVNESEVDVC